MADMSLYPIAQSAYRENHSTETALLKVKNDILVNMNKQHVTVLVLLDLSAAFDTVDHGILLEALKKLRLGGKAFEPGFDRIYQGAVSGYPSVGVSLRVLN